MASLEQKLKGRDHALILLGIASAILIWWLLHRRAGANVTNETIVNQDGVTFPGNDNSDYLPPGYSFNVGGDTINMVGQPTTDLYLPDTSVPIENCGCGCSDFTIPNVAPGPIPTLIVSNPARPQPVYVITAPPPPPPAPPRANSGSGFQIAWTG